MHNLQSKVQFPVDKAKWYDKTKIWNIWISSKPNLFACMLIYWFNIPEILIGKVVL